MPMTVQSSAVAFPANLSETTRLLWVDEQGSVRLCEVGGNLGSVLLERSVPVRRFYAWPGKRSFDGRWWSSTSRSHLGFESLLERQALLAFDFDRDVVGLAVQPFALLWPRRHSSTGPRHHVPDLFVRRADGRGVVVDVRPAGRIDERSRVQFARTQQVAALVGWDFQLFTGLPSPRAANLMFLAGYRYDRCVPAGTVRAGLIAAFQTPRPLSRGVAAAAAATGVSADVVLAGAYHLLWQQDLQVDLDRLLGADSEVGG